MEKVVQGNCPVVNKRCVVSATYLKSVSLDGKTTHIRDSLDCNERRCGCSVSAHECPLAKQFPKEIAD